MLGRRKRGSPLCGLIGNNIANSMMRDITDENRPTYPHKEPQYDIQYLPKGRLNMLITLEKYNLLPPLLKRIWRRIDLDAMFEEVIDELEQTPKEALMENPLVKDNTPLRSMILSETKETEEESTDSLFSVK